MRITKTFARLTAFALVAGFTLTAPGTAVAATSNDVRQSEAVTLPIEPLVQAKTKWCWIATGLTVVRYLGNANARKLSQNDWCNVVNNRTAGTDCPNEPGPSLPMIRAASRYGVAGGTLVLTTVTFDGIKYNIDRNQPLWMSLKWKKTEGGHLITIAGYNDDEREFQILDPWPKSARIAWYDDEYSRDNDRYTWRETVYGLRKAGRDASERHTPSVLPQAQSLAAQAPTMAQTDDAPRLDVDGLALWAALHSRAGGTSMRVDDATSAQVRALASSTLSRRIDRMMADARTTLGATPADRTVTGLTATPRRGTGSAQLSDQLVSTYVLNPDFIHGRSNNPVEHSGYAQLALTAAGDTAVVNYGFSRGQVKYAGYATGDLEVRYALQAQGGIAFMEPSTRAWFRLNGNAVTPLDDVARDITATPLTLEEYRASVQRRIR